MVERFVVPLVLLPLDEAIAVQPMGRRHQSAMDLVECSSCLLARRKQPRLTPRILYRSYKYLGATRSAATVERRLVIE